MASPQVSAFLDGLHASRILDDALLQTLPGLPEAQHDDVTPLVNHVVAQGWLTPYQADETRQGRATGLNFRQFRILERLEDTSFGQRFVAAMPGGAGVVLLTLMHPDYLEPADTLAEYQHRLQTAQSLTHPNVVRLYEQGPTQVGMYLVQEYLDAIDLFRMVNDMGAMPTTLAVEYAVQSAMGLEAAHHLGLTHGDFSPARMILYPVIRRAAVASGTGKAIAIRPAPGASVKVEGIGLAARRPPLLDMAFGATPRMGAIAFAAPERLTRAGMDIRGDIYSLGASLYYLLCTRPPIMASEPTEILEALKEPRPERLERLRADLPPGLADVVHRMMAIDPLQRPGTLGEIIASLTPFRLNEAIPVAHAVEAVAIAEAVPMPKAPQPEAFADDHMPEYTPTNATEAPRRSERRMVEKKPKIGGPGMLILAVAMHIVAFGIIALYFLELPPFSPSKPEPEKARVEPPKKKPK